MYNKGYPIKGTGGGSEYLSTPTATYLDYFTLPPPPRNIFQFLHRAPLRGIVLLFMPPPPTYFHMFSGPTILFNGIAVTKYCILLFQEAMEQLKEYNMSLDSTLNSMDGPFFLCSVYTCASTVCSDWFKLYLRIKVNVSVPNGQHHECMITYRCYWLEMPRESRVANHFYKSSFPI